MSEVVAAGLVVLVLAGVALWLGSLLPASRWRAPAIGLLTGALAAVTWSALALRDLPTPEDEVELRPIQVPGDGYLSSSSCRGCHPGEYDSWHDSFHRTMTQVASRASVVGDFDEVTLHYHGHDYRLFWRGDQPYFETTAAALGLARTSAPGEDAGRAEVRGVEPGTRVVQPVMMTTGSHHLQAYWYATGVGRAVEFFPFLWMIPEGRWAPRESVFLQPTAPIDVELAPLSEEERWQTQRQWMHSCLHCHSTRPSPRVAELDTRVVELGISCEACHGPGEEHAERMRSPLARYLLHARGEERASADAEPVPAIVEPTRLDAARSAQVCGQCHSLNYANPEEWRRKLAGGSTFRPGDELTDTHTVCRGSHPESLEQCGNPNLDHQYWSDGMLRVSGREYVALLDSPCAQRGDLTCVSCHELHPEPGDPRPRSEWADDQLGLDMESNASCTQCHAELAATSALERHSHHAPGSSGSVCLDCHMPSTAYGLLKATRSHQISNPSVAESVETGRPNACNQCHLDRSLGWTAEHLGRWYGQEAPELGAVERATPASIVWALSGDAGQRALMAWSYGWETALEASDRRWVAPLLVQLLDDPYDAVRLIAARSLRRSHPELLEDGELGYDALAPVETRRAAAARVYARWAALPESQRREPRTLVAVDESLAAAGVDGDLFLWLWKNRDESVVILTE